MKHKQPILLLRAVLTLKLITDLNEALEMIKRGRVHVNNKPQTNSSYLCYSGDTIQVSRISESALTWLKYKTLNESNLTTQPKDQQAVKLLPKLYEALETLMDTLEEHGSKHNAVKVAFNCAKPIKAEVQDFLKGDK